MGSTGKSDDLGCGFGEVSEELLCGGLGLLIIYGYVDACIYHGIIYRCVDAFTYAGIIYGYVDMWVSRNKYFNIDDHHTRLQIRAQP